MTPSSSSRKVTDARRAGRDWRRQVPRAFATLLWVVALVCALAAVSGAARLEFQPVRKAIDALLVPAPANLAYAVFLGTLASAVLRRKRLAYWVLVAYFSLTLLVGLLAGVLLLTVGGNDLTDDAGERLFTTLETVGVWVGIVFAAGALALLLAARREFYARVRSGSTFRALGVFLGLAVLSVGLGYLLLLVEPGSLHTWSDRLGYAVEKVFGGAITLDLTRRGHAPGWVNLVLGGLGAISFVAGLFTLVRSQRANAVLQPGEEERIRELLARYGDRDSLGYFATRRDKAAVFSPSGKAVITYRVVNGVSLASGDPIGDPEAWGPAIEAWLGQAREYAWTPAVLGASEAGAQAYRRHGLKVLQLGDEAILLTREFDLDGRDMRPVRQAVHRVERAGYTARVRRHAEIPPEELSRLADLATSWRDTEHERGFSMALGRLGDPADGDCVLVEARDGEGRVRGLLSFSPWGAHGVSLDLMRRDRAAENGITEFMVTALLAAGPRIGVERVSLNFAAFRSVFEQGARIGAGPVIRLWRHTLLFFSRWWQLESLYLSNAKYQPHWTPRYLCFAERRELARVGIAAGAAEGFLALPGGRPTPLHGVPPAGGGVGFVPPAAATVRAVPPEAAAPAQRPEQVRVRLAKLDRLRAEGVDPYPVGYPRTASCASVRERHAGLAPDTGTGETVAVAGRVMLVRDHGRVLFATVRDGSGDLQLMLEHDLDRWRATVDIGDHVGATGEVYATRHGELSVRVADWQLTAKCLRPLPDKHHGLADPEARVRQRYLDLAINADARDLLRARGAALHSLRSSLVGRGFLEVETPILQRVHGGANARPFVTHSNAYDLRLSLRIAPELYLKRLAVGGVERVYELGRAFRNEGVDATHNPEFTVLEAYQAYADYHDMRALARELIVAAATAVHGTPVARRSDGTLVDLGGEWPARTVNEAISTALGEEVTADTDVAALRKLCDAAGVPYDPRWERGAVLLELYERLVEARTEVPTFYLDFPTDVSPLTRQHRHDPRLAERWDLVAFGMELGTAYTELVDPTEQRRRLTEQSLKAAGGDPEAMELDEDFLTALEYAMPPTGGLGLGVDRLVMLLTGRSIRETLPFPLVRESS